MTRIEYPKCAGCRERDRVIQSQVDQRSNRERDQLREQIGKATVRIQVMSAQNAKLRAQLMQAIAVLGELVSARDNAPAAVEERTVQSWRQARAFLADLFDAPKEQP